jgi:hypothetical protein
MRHPRDMGVAEVEAFLPMMVSERKASASTHNQALSALLFLCGTGMRGFSVIRRLIRQAKSTISVQNKLLTAWKASLCRIEP